MSKALSFKMTACRQGDDVPIAVVSGDGAECAVERGRAVPLGYTFPGSGQGRARALRSVEGVSWNLYAPRHRWFLRCDNDH